MAYKSTSPSKGKSMMASQRDRGGHNKHGHKHPAQIGREVYERIDKAPVLPKVGLTPQKQRTRC